MGTTISEQNFSENALESTIIQDQLLLSYDEEQLFAKQFPHLYSIALCHGVIHRRSDRKTYDKMNTRRKKLTDVSQVFTSANITDIKAIERSLRHNLVINNLSPQQHLSEYQDTSLNTMRRLEEFQIKSMKYHQREITFLTNNVDPYHHIIEARFSVLERAFLAKIRTRKRAEIAGQDENYGLDVKKHFLCYFFGRTDYYMNGKKKEIESMKQQSIKAANTTDNNESNDKDKTAADADKNEESKKRKKKKTEIVHIEDDNIMYIGDDDFILTLSKPSYSKLHAVPDSFIERILVLADTLPKELDELVSFKTSIDSKRKAHLDKIVKTKKKAAEVAAAATSIDANAPPNIIPSPQPNADDNQNQPPPPVQVQAQRRGPRRRVRSNNNNNNQPSSPSSMPSSASDSAYSSTHSEHYSNNNEDDDDDDDDDDMNSDVVDGNNANEAPPPHVDNNENRHREFMNMLQQQRAAEQNAAVAASLVQNNANVAAASANNANADGGAGLIDMAQSVLQQPPQQLQPSPPAQEQQQYSYYQRPNQDLFNLGRQPPDDFEMQAVLELSMQQRQAQEEQHLLNAIAESHAAQLQHAIAQNDVDNANAVDDADAEVAAVGNEEAAVVAVDNNEEAAVVVAVIPLGNDENEDINQAQPPPEPEPAPQAAQMDVDAQAPAIEIEAPHEQKSDEQKEVFGIPPIPIVTPIPIPVLPPDVSVDNEQKTEEKEQTIVIASSPPQPQSTPPDVASFMQMAQDGDDVFMPDAEEAADDLRELDEQLQQAMQRIIAADSYDQNVNRAAMEQQVHRQMHARLQQRSQELEQKLQTDEQAVFQLMQQQQIQLQALQQQQEDDALAAALAQSLQPNNNAAVDDNADANPENNADINVVADDVHAAVSQVAEEESQVQAQLARQVQVDELRTRYQQQIEERRRELTQQRRVQQRVQAQIEHLRVRQLQSQQENMDNDLAQYMDSGDDNSNRIQGLFGAMGMGGMGGMMDAMRASQRGGRGGRGRGGGGRGGGLSGMDISYESYLAQRRQSSQSPQAQPQLQPQVVLSNNVGVGVGGGLNEQFGSGAQNIANLWRDQPAQSFNRRHNPYGHHGFGRRGRGRGGMLRSQWDDFQHRHRHRRRRDVADEEKSEQKDAADEKKDEVKEADDAFKSEELLNFLLNKCIQDSIEIIQTAKAVHVENESVKEKIVKREELRKLQVEKEKLEQEKADKDKSEAVTVTATEEKKEVNTEKVEEEKLEIQILIPTASPVTRLLKVIQRDLTMRACSRQERSDKDITSFIQYLQQLTCATLDILKTFILPIFEECKQECINIIEHSFITHCFLPAITILSGILYSPMFEQSAKKLWKDLVIILRYLDEICSMDEELLTKSTDIMDSNDQLTAENTKYIESPHSYPPNTLDEKNIRIPGATHLCITFDRKCHTERGRDLLDILLPNGLPICDSLHGQARLWPQTSLIIPGNEVLFRFRSEANHDNRNWWGYGALITGLKFGIFPQCCVFLDLLHTTAHIVGKCLRSVMVGKKCNQQEIAHRKWLESPLFSKGRELADSDGDEYDSDEDAPVKRAVAVTAEDEAEDGKDDEKAAIKQEDVGLPSPTWSPLAKHQEFLEDLAALKADSKAAAFHASMFALCKKTGFESMGGPVVDDTINVVIAAMLKHLGLVEIARKCASDYGSTPKQLQSEWNDKLLFVFRKAKALRTWIGNEKRRHQLENEAKITEAKEKGDELSEEQLLVFSKWTSYEGICAEIKKKAQFLLQMRPFCRMFMEGISDEETTSFSMTVQVSQLKSLERQFSDSSVRSDKVNNLDQWRLAFDTWKTINNFEAHKARKKDEKKGITSLPDMIITFIQCETSLETFIGLIKRHRRRAKLRSDSMECLLGLLNGTDDSKALTCLSPKVSLLREWKCPLREYGDYDVGPRTIHFLSNIQSCGAVHEKHIRVMWEKLYLYFAELIKDVSVQLPLKQQAISAWAMVLTPGEETFIASTKVLDTVHAMLTQYIGLLKSNWNSAAVSSPAKVQVSVPEEEMDALMATVGIDWKTLAPHQKDNNNLLLKSLYNLLSLMLMGFNNGKKGWLNNTTMPTPDDLNLGGLQVQILHCTHNEIVRNIARLSSIKIASHSNAKIHIAEANNDWDSNADIRFMCTNYDATFLQVEQLIYAHIACIRHLTYKSNSRSIKSFVKSDAFLITLCELLYHGTPRIQRVALLILRDITQFIPPCGLTKVNAVELIKGTAKREALLPSQPLTPRSAAPAKSALGMLHKMEEKQGLLEDDTSASDAELVRFFFVKCGELMLAQNPNITQHVLHEWSALDHTMALSAEIKRDLSLDYVIFLRALLKNIKWRGFVLETLFNSLRNASKLINLNKGEVYDDDDIKKSPEDDSDMDAFMQVKILMASLSILGGHGDRLRPGCRVQLKINEEDDAAMAEKGICITVNRSTGLCQVLFDNVKRPVTIEISKVIPMSEMSALGIIPINEQLLQYLTIFTDPIHLESRDPACSDSEESTHNVVPEESKTDIEHKNDSADPPVPPNNVNAEPLQTEQIQPVDAVEWNCPQCTLINQMSASSCGVCGFKNPMAPTMPTPSFAAMGFGAMAMPAPKKKEKKETDVEIPAAVPEPSLSQLLFHQLRSLGLKALCVLMEQSDGTSVLLKCANDKLLSNLLAIATRPTALDQYRSIRFLEELENRLLEKIHDRPLSFVERVPKSARSQTQRQLLKFSTYKNLKLNLPKTLDSESSKNVRFSSKYPYRIMFKTNPEYFVGYCRSTELAPQSIPAYYYEVTIVKMGTGALQLNDKSLAIEHNWNIAVGVWRSGMQFQGKPGAQSSYAIGCNGFQYNTVSRESIPHELKTLSFAEGDTIGVGWDGKQYQKIYFTKNGVILSQHEYSQIGFENVQGQFYPMIWMQSNNAIVEVNLGNAAFKFPFEDTKLDKKWLAEMEKHNDPSTELSEVEMIRRTRAEELVIMMGGNYPLDLAVVSLEQCSDNLEVAAVWLLDNAGRELDRFFEDALRFTAQSGDAVDNEEEEKKNQRQEEADIYDENGRINLMLWLNTDLDDPDDSGAGARRKRRGAAGTSANLLDDEIDAQLPVGLALNEITGHHHLREDADNNPLARHRNRAAVQAAEQKQNDAASRLQIGIGSRLRQQLPPLKLNSIKCGEHLSVWSDANRICYGKWPKTWNNLRGKTGVVHSIDVNKKEVSIEFMDHDLGVFNRQSIPVRALHQPIESYIDPLTELNIRSDDVIEEIREQNGPKKTDIQKTIPIFDIGSHFVQVEHALSILKIRKSVISLIRNWPDHEKEFNLKIFGGIDTVIRLLLLDGAEALSSGTSKSKLLVKKKNHLMDDFGKILQLLKDEQHKFDVVESAESELYLNSQLRLVRNIFDKKSWKKKNPTRSDLLDTQNGEAQTLTQALVEECILHFVMAVHNPSVVLQFESDHLPYKEQADDRNLVYVPGALRLLVTFDEKCELATDMKTSLRFYADKEMTDLIVSCRRSGAENFPTFIVPSNRFWYKFSTSNSARFFGYRFFVKPIERHIDDKQALDDNNFELGCWLFELLLKYKHILRVNEFIVPLYNAVSFFVLNLRSSGKAKGIEQLIQLLLSVHKQQEEKECNISLNLSKLKDLGEQMDVVVDKLMRNDRTVQSQVLNSVVELMAITELFTTLPTPPPLIPSSIDAAEEPPISVADDNILHIEKSGITKKGPNEKLLVTRQQRPDRLYDASELYISKIRVNSAVWGYDLDGDDEKSTDITTRIQQHVNYLGETRLILPPRKVWRKAPFKDDIFRNDPDPKQGEDRLQCLIKYDIIRSIYDPIVDDIRCDVLKKRTLHITGNNEIKIEAKPSTFDRVVEMSSLTLSISSKENKITQLIDHYHLPSLFLGEVYRASHINSTFYTILRPDVSRGFTQDADDNKQSAIPCPTGGTFAVREFTLMFWLFLDYKNNTMACKCDGKRNIIRKGMRNNVLPRVYFDNKSNKIRCDVSTKANGLVSIQSSADLKCKKWLHVGLSVDCIGIRLYVDGKLSASQRTNSPLLTNCDPFYIGKCPPGIEQVYDNKVCYGFNGYLLDCRYYLRKLNERTIHTYFMKCKPNEKKKPNISRIQFKTADKDPIKKTKISFNVLSSNCAGNTRAFNPKLWTPSMDNEIMELFEHSFNSTLSRELISLWNEDANAEHKVPQHVTQLHIEPFTLKPDRETIEKYSRIQHFDVLVLKTRYLMLRMLNYKMEGVFPLVDFSQVGLEWSLAARLCRLRSLIFSDLKQTPWRKVLQSTAANGRTSVLVNRPKALKAKEQEREMNHNNLKKTVFGQIYRTLNFIKPSHLRCSPGHRPWSVTFEGEGGTDAGGLFRESLSALGEDLMDCEHLRLFIKCPNSRGYGDNQDKFIPNPSMSSSLHLSMWTFIGKLMGVAIRGKYYLNIDLPSIVWKPLVGMNTDIYDLQEIDSLCYNIIDKVGNIEKEIRDLNEESFQDVVSDNFTTTSSDGRQILLKNAGDKIAVTLSNRFEYIRLLKEYRLHEFDTQINAMRRGLATIVPISLLPLFTWRQLELMVCGKREIDVQLLKANTIYKRGVKATDKHIKFLWDILDSEFTNEQKRNFIRFVWGQSRLPTKSEDFNDPFGILSCHGKDNDLTLPVSHTCFFTLELPKYSSKEIMKKKLLYAINNCTAIDTDFVAQNVNWEEE